MLSSTVINNDFIMPLQTINKDSIEKIKIIPHKASSGEHDQNCHVIVAEDTFGHVLTRHPVFSLPAKNIADRICQEIKISFKENEDRFKNIILSIPKIPKSATEILYLLKTKEPIEEAIIELRKARLSDKSDSLDLLPIILETFQRDLDATAPKTLNMHRFIKSFEDECLKKESKWQIPSVQKEAAVLKIFKDYTKTTLKEARDKFRQAFKNYRIEKESEQKIFPVPKNVLLNILEDRKKNKEKRSKELKELWEAPIALEKMPEILKKLLINQLVKLRESDFFQKLENNASDQTST